MTATRIGSEDRRNFGNIVPKEGAGPRSLDQADGLRRLLRGRPRHARVIAVTSGKGGVGKTNVAVNLSVALASRGRRTVLIDLDLGLANADIVFDLTPRYNLSDVLSGRRTIEEVVVEAPGGVLVVPGASGVERLANLAENERMSLLSSFEALHRSADFIILDTGAGISRNTTAFLAAADDILVVTVPEPTAVVDAFAVIKMVASQPDHGNLYSLINMVENRAEAEKVAGGITRTASNLLNAYVDRIGYVLRDPKVGQAVRRRRPFLQAFPGAVSSGCVRAIAGRLASGAEDRPEDRPGFIRRLFSAFSRGD